MSEFFYNFMSGGLNRGYSYLYVNDTVLYSHTRFLLDNDETYSNVFRLKLHDGHVLACKHGDADWIDFSNQSVSHYPGCAYPLLLPKVLDGSYKYVQVSEDNGSILGDVQLHRDGNDIVESQAGEFCRRFTMKHTFLTPLMAETT